METLYLSKRYVDVDTRDTGGYVDDMKKLGSSILKEDPEIMYAKIAISDERYFWIKSWCIELKRRT